MQQYLLDFLNLIPPQKIISYKKLGQIFNIHPRQIGKILNKNVYQQKYPCYKVINTNGKIGGYNLGVDKKAKKLINEGVDIINGKINKYYFWEPKIRNYFIAIPLQDENLIKFKNCQTQIKKLNIPQKTIFQKPTTPHITFVFFGNIGLDIYQKIIYKTIQFFKHYNHKQIFNFDNFSNFNQKIFFKTLSHPKQLQTLIQLQNNYLNYLHLNNFSKKYTPHITIFKTKQNITTQTLNQIKPICKNYNFKICFDKLRFYAAFDQNYQTPLIDINL